MQKYTKAGFTIIVDLGYKDFQVRANILKEKNMPSDTYDVMLELRRSDIPRWDTLDESHYTLKSENINMYVYEFIMDLFKQGFFDYPIRRYEYDLKCFDYGDDYLNDEQIDVG